MLATTLPLFFSILATATLATTVKVVKNDIIDVEPLPPTSGLYYQPINRMQFVEDVWHFIIEVDHGIIFEELQSLYTETNQLVVELKKQETLANCSNFKIINVQIDTFVYKRIRELVEKHNILDNSVKKVGDFEDHKKLNLNEDNDNDDDGSSLLVRRRRGILNFVGSVDKFLFGVMDSNDAHELHELAKSSNALDSQVKQLTDDIINLSNYVEHKRCVDEQRNDLCLYANAKIELIIQQLYEIDLLYEKLDRAVENVKYNRLNNIVMSADKLLSEMINVTSSVPKGLVWPVGLTRANVQLLMDNIVKVHVFITEHRKLLFIVEVPLVNQQEFDVYQIIPIPYCEKEKCAIILPDSKYLGISTDRRNYVRLPDDVAKSCNVVNDLSLCYKPGVVLESSQATLCDIKILLKSEDKIDFKQDCDVRVGKFDDEIFYPILDYNNWLYVLRHNTELTINCIGGGGNGGDGGGYIEPVTLAQGAGIIKARGDQTCKLITKKSKISIHELKNKLKTVIIAPLSTSFNLSYILSDIDKLELQALKVNNDLDHNNLKGLTDRLVDLRKRMENNTVFSGADVTDEAESPSFWDLFNIDLHLIKTVFVWIVMGFIVLVAYKVYNCCCPGSCTHIFKTLCSFRFRKYNDENKKTVVRIDRELQYINKHSNKTSSSSPLKKSTLYKDTNVDDDYEDDDFYKKI
jgi:hypothetical protein